MVLLVLLWNFPSNFCRTNEMRTTKIQIRVILDKSLGDIEDEIYLTNKLLLQRNKAIYFLTRKEGRLT